MQNRTAADSEPFLICGPRQGGVGVNPHRGLYLPLYWGQGPGNARQWVMCLEARSRNHMIKSCCCTFCRLGMGRGAREVWGCVRIDIGTGRVAGQNSAQLGSLMPPLISPALPCGRHFPKMPTWYHMHLHSGVPSVPGDAPVFPCLKDSESAAPQAGPGSPASLVCSGVVSARRVGIRPSHGLSC